MTYARRRLQLYVSMLLALCLSALYVDVARAATVAIVSADTTPARAELSSRLRGELSALGSRIVLLSRPPRLELDELERREWLERAAVARDIDAAIEVIGESETLAADVWIFQRSPRRAHVTRVVVEPGSADPAGTLAIRAIEVLRSHNLEVDLAASQRARGDEPEQPPPPAPPSSDQAPAESAPPALESAPSRAELVSVELGGALRTGLAGLGPALLPALRVDWRAHPLLLLQLTASGLGTEPTLRASGGSVQVAQSYATLGVCYCPRSLAALRPYLALGAGASRVSLRGAARPPARGHAISEWSLLVEAGAGARLRLRDRYYATLTGHVQLAEPRLDIHVVDDKVASTGRPYLVASLMVGAWL